MQVVIPMSGSGARFQQAGYTEPKPLLDIAGRPMIARLIENFPSDWRFIFICNEEHLRDVPRLREVLIQSAPGATIIGIAPHKRGPVHTVWEARDQIRDDLPTLVNYCDFSFAWDPADFVRFAERTRCEGALFSYKGFHPHYLGNTLYAYSRLEKDRVVEVKEKGHFTPDRTQEYASSGTYYFSSGKLVKEYFRRALDADLQLNGEFYVSLVYNLLIRDQRRVRVYEIPFFLQWGTPEDLEDYVYWHNTFERFPAKRPGPIPGGPRLVMPMAGMGSRFQERAALPKPLIPVLDRPMFETARTFLPAGSQPPVLIVLKDIASTIRQHETSARLVVLDEPTSGQAETTRRGLEGLDPEEPVLISACDHGLLWNAQSWETLIAGKPDVVVVGQRGYPGARRTPKSFAYIDADESGRVRRVSVKEPISGTPQKDRVLVGTFYFRQVGVLRELIELLQSRNMRVNGELYLDSVVNLAVERGLDVRCFDAQAYLNWGSPDALAEFSYWNRYFHT